MAAAMQQQQQEAQAQAQQAALLQLLSSSANELNSLYAQIGDPATSSHSALHQLHETLANSIRAHLDDAKRLLERRKKQCLHHTQHIQLLRVLLGQSDAASSSTAAAAIDAMSLHQRQQHLQQEVRTLQQTYEGRRNEAAKWQGQLEQHRLVLGDKLLQPIPPALPLDLLQAAAEQEQAGKQETEQEDARHVTWLRDLVSSPSTTCLPLSHISALQAECKRAEADIVARNQQLVGDLDEIVGQWSELHLPPDTINDPLDAAILSHMQIRPIWHAAAPTAALEAVASSGSSIFKGEFESFVNTTRDLDAYAPPESMAPTPCPTRKSATVGDLLTTGAASASSSAAAAQALPDRILPTDANLLAVRAKLGSLQAEKVSREGRIQALYDELSELWMKFDVPEDEMDAFVQSHCGSTLDVIASYERELHKMQQLRKEHMSLFIEKVRERIRRLCDVLRLAEHERFELFPQCFAAVSVDDGATEEMLAEHEQIIEQLSEQVKLKAPILEIIDRYQALCDEEAQMIEDAKDPNRFKNTRGDPGRLLREEKTRKRIKVQKPKMQQELLQAIPEWEAQHGTQFTIDGEAFLPILYELVGDAAAQAGGAAGAAKKRARTASIQSDLSSHGNPPLSSSVAHNRVAATPLRGVPATPMTTNKRARVAPPSSVRPAAMAPPATTARAPSRIAVPSTGGQSRIARPGAAGTARPAPASTAKIRAPSNFRPRPSASLRAYVDCGGGRRSAEGADSFASLSAARTASHSGTSAMRAPDRSAAHFSSASAPNSSRLPASTANWCMLGDAA